MGANQGKAIVVVLDRRDRHLPAANRLTALAVGTELPPMEVGMTLRALRWSGREDQAGMATDATYGTMLTQQREAGLPVMVEFRLAPDGLPGGSGVAVFAARLEWSVRVRRTAANGIQIGRASCRERV